MSFLIIALLAASPQTGQIMAGPSFERFARQVDRSCPARQLRTITPGDLSWEQETFDDQMSPAKRKLLNAANRSGARCAGRDGLSCSTGEALDAMVRTKMLRPFVMFACAHPQP